VGKRRIGPGCVTNGNHTRSPAACCEMNIPVIEPQLGLGSSWTKGKGIVSSGNGRSCRCLCISPRALCGCLSSHPAAPGNGPPHESADRGIVGCRPLPDPSPCAQGGGRTGKSASWQFATKPHRIAAMPDSHRFNTAASTSIDPVALATSFVIVNQRFGGLTAHDAAKPATCPVLCRLRCMAEEGNAR